MNAEQKKVFAALSGGVDSSVSAALLTKAGYDVTGVFIRGWYPPWVSCTWREDRRDAMRVCAHLGIPFFTLDAGEAYKREVVDTMVASYRAGRVPNPDIWCNRAIKFGVFLRFALARGADMVATGHYARLHRAASDVKNQTSTVELLVGKDTEKDQSYFLWTLTQEDLAQTLFPVGGYRKEEVRRMAREFGLHTADKKDSQGLCFIGELDMRDFLKHFIDAAPGAVQSEAGEVIGEHEGAVLYTLGQRHGFTVTKKEPDSGPFYVVAKDIAHNTLTVSERYYGDAGGRGADTFVLESVNWVGELPAENRRYWGRVRHRQEPQPCRAERTDDGVWRVVFDAPQYGAAPGQSVVLYRGEVCLGGGVIV